MTRPRRTSPVLALGVLGGCFLVHGIISLVKHYRNRFRRSAWLDENGKYLPEVSITPTRTATLTGLSWRF